MATLYLSGLARVRCVGWRGWGALLALPFLSACGTLPASHPGWGGFGDGPPAVPVDAAAVPNAVPSIEARSPYGNPDYYEVDGRRYHVMKSSAGYVERGIASWYGSKFHGRRTSSGELYDMNAMTAAHPTLPIPTYVEVTNLRNGRKVIVKVNDRGPFLRNRIIDLSYVAAVKLGITTDGTGLVEVRAIDPAVHASQVKNETAAVHASADLYLQVGAFADRKNAERLSQRVGALGPDAAIQVSEAAKDQADGPVYRVRIGPLPSVEAADRLTRELTNMGVLDSQVVIN
jgi:peptidoglycan lytic transglycosylase